MSKYIRTLTITYDLPISQREIPLFRGAVLKSLGDKANLLYHNHTGKDTFRYGYPKIQYKRLNGKAAIVCVEEGVDLIGQLLSVMPNKLLLGEREQELAVAKVVPARLMVQTWETLFKYHINNWLPLNTKNYLLYKSTTSLAERIQLLERILKGNLLSMLKGLDIHVEQEVKLSISHLSEPHILYNKGVALMAFNADFITNLSIPNNLGVGKNASIGNGVVYQKKKKDIDKEKENQ